MASNRRRVFVEEYLRSWNATEAAEIAGFAHPRQAGSRLLSYVDIRAEIKQRIDEKAMKADEVLRRLSDMARGDLGDFMDIESMSFDISLQKAKELGLTHLIKKVKQRTITTLDKSGEETETNTQEIELYSALEALQTMGKYHGLFVDRHDITSGGEPITLNVVYDK